MGTNQRKLGSLLSYLSVFINIIISLILSPFIVNSLGKSQYGLYQLIWSVVGYMIVFDFGFTNSVIRYVSKYRAEKDSKAEKEFLGTIMIVYSIISVLILLFSMVIYYNINRIFGGSFEAGQAELAKKLFIIMTFNFVLNVFLNIFPAIINAYEKFVFQRIITIVRLISRTLVVFIVLSMGGKSISIAIVDTIFTIVFFLAQVLYVFFNLKVRVSNKFNFPLFKEVFLYSFFIFLGIVVDQVNWKVDQLIIGIKMNTENVGIYSIAMQFPVYYMSFAGAISGVFLPKASRMHANGAKDEEFTDLMISTGRVQWMILLIMLIGFGCFGKQFVRLWLGEGFEYVYSIAFMIMAALTVPLFQSVGLSVQQAKNKHHFRAILYLGVAILNVILSVVMVDWIGLIGASLGTVIAYALGNIIIMNIYYQKRLGINVIRFFKEISKGMVFATILASLAGILINFISVSGWLGFFIKILIFAVAYIVIFYRIGLNSNERLALSSMIKRRLGNESIG